MCVIFWTTADPNYDLVIASNRDEFLSRPTLPASWHSFTSASSSSSSSAQISGSDDGHRILSARDSTGGGTWLGVTRNGAFATLTNFTELSAPLPEGMDVFESRGKLVRDWLVAQSTHSSRSEEGRRSGEEVEREVKGYLEGLRGRLDRFPGFNLLVGSISSEGTVVGYITNRNPDGSLNHDREPDIFLPPTFSNSTKEEVPPGGMSNSVLSQPWSKITSGSLTFQSALSHYSTSNPSGEDALVEELFDLLWTSSNPAPVQRSELRNSVLISPLELPAAGEGAKDWYATRTSTVILLGKDGTGRMVERDTFGVEGGKVVLLNGTEGSGAVRGRDGGQREFDWSIQ